MTQYQEPPEAMDDQDLDIVRAWTSLVEELEAIGAYHQRVVVTEDRDLREMLAHNRDEEIEHLAMTLEWLRRLVPTLDDSLRRYLFTGGPVPGPGDRGRPGTSGRGLGLGKPR